MNYMKSELEKAYYSAFEANGKHIDTYNCGCPNIEELINNLYRLRWNLVEKDEFAGYFDSSLIVSYDNAIALAYNTLIHSAEQITTKGLTDVSETWIYDTLEKQKEIHRLLVDSRIHFTVYHTIKEFNKEINKNNSNTINSNAN